MRICGQNDKMTWDLARMVLIITRVVTRLPMTESIAKMTTQLATNILSRLRPTSWEVSRDRTCLAELAEPPIDNDDDH